MNDNSKFISELYLDKSGQVMTQKIDLVMWTFNSAKELPPTLMSIEKVIPKGQVNQKIIEEGHNTDETKNIGKKFG